MKFNNIPKIAIVFVLLMIAIPFFVGTMVNNYISEMTGGPQGIQDIFENLPEGSNFAPVKKLRPLFWVTEHLYLLVPAIFVFAIMIVLFFKLKGDWKALKSTEADPVQNPNVRTNVKTFVNGEEISSEKPLGDVIKENIAKSAGLSSEQLSDLMKNSSSTVTINGKEVSSADSLEELIGKNLSESQKNTIEGFLKRND